MNDMNDLDDKIRKALSNKDAAMIGDPNDGLRLDQQVIAVFKHGNRFVNTIAFVFTFVFLGLGIYCVVRFFDTEVTKELIAWGLGFSMCMIAVSMFKLWFWMEMHRIAVTREVKRVELLAARLLQVIQSKDNA